MQTSEPGAAQRRKLERARKIDNERVHGGVRQIVASRDGRRFLWRLFEWTDILSTAYRPTDRDTCFQLGKQSVGQELLALLEEVDPGAWLKLRAEQLLLLEELKEKEKEDE